ncbi:protein Bouncer-like [Carassius carassius]|uniref:protein Bouncer-like n=1 Tax=Carassius carassius TaxID=217509 RepID=UPI0028695352|nr:protein Bouncer-like [Carassius carassius]
MEADCAALSRSAVLALCLLGVLALECHYCPLQAAGTRCNITTECHAHERCSTGWRRYGRVHVLAVQGCASPELCASNQTLTHKGIEYEITYTCCCRDLCNTAKAENLLQQLTGAPISPAGDTCPED